MEAKNLSNIIEDVQSSFKNAWSNVWFVFCRDLKRLFKNPIAIIVIGFVLVFPSLYAWIGTNAYWDPYSNTSGLKIAIVNEDKTADTGVAGEINLGDMIEDALHENPILGWDFTNKQDAMQKLDDGSVYSAIVIPYNFSESFATLLKDSNNRTYVHFDYYINERENGAAVKIFDIASTTIEGQINQKFIQTVSNILAEKAHDITGNLADSANKCANTIAGKVDNVSSSVNRLKSLIESGNATIFQAKNTIDSSKNLISDIKNDVHVVLDTTNSAKNTCRALRERINIAIEELERKGIEFQVIKEILNNLMSSIDQDIYSLDKISEIMYKVDSTCNQLGTLNSQIYNMLGTTEKLSDNVYIKVDESYSVLKNLSKIIDGDIAASPFVLKALIDSNTEDLGTFMSTPVQMDNHTINEVKLYGIGASPFFTNLTLWIAGLVLIALFRTEVDPPKRKKFNARQAYVSRGMLFAFVAILQGIVCALGDFAIGVTCDNYVLFVLTCAIASFTYTNIIYMLSACFKHIGKAIAVVLIIMQIPGSSGMFPVEMMPQAYVFINPFLPFTYGIDGLREAIINPNYAAWSWDIIVLLIFVFVSLIIGVYAREHLVNLNALFDKKLSKTGLMECDAQDHMTNNESTVSSIVGIIEESVNNTKAVSSLNELLNLYKQRRKNALISLWILPTLLLVVLSICFAFVSIEINTKIILLMLWLVLIIACCSWVIILEFRCSRLNLQLEEINNQNKVSKNSKKQVSKTRKVSNKK